MPEDTSNVTAEMAPEDEGTQPWPSVRDGLRSALEGEVVAESQNGRSAAFNASPAGFNASPPAVGTTKRM